MPYANVEKRRQFQREYKRKWREAQTKIHPLQGFKIYICPRFPFLWVGRVQFNSGFLITNSAEVQAQVVAHREFGKFIFPIALDLSGPSKEDE
jgi:hypothetical protein